MRLGNHPWMGVPCVRMPFYTQHNGQILTINTIHICAGLCIGNNNGGVLQKHYCEELWNYT